jgi:hypothetical protein
MIQLGMKLAVAAIALSAAGSTGSQSFGSRLNGSKRG